MIVSGRCPTTLALLLAVAGCSADEPESSGGTVGTESGTSTETITGATTSGTTPSVVVELCCDGLDNDGDGDIDCDDGDCVCPPPDLSGVHPDTDATGTLVDSLAGSLGDNLAVAGDVNGDGADDLLVGEGFGITHLVLGPVIGQVPIASAHARLQFGDPPNQSGQPVSGLGDLDGDGLDDFGIGRVDNSAIYEPGCVSVFTHLPSGDAAMSSADASLCGELPLTYHHYLPIDTGDVDGDGTRDLLVLAYTEDGFGGPGTAFLSTDPLGGTGLLSDSEAIFHGDANEGSLGLARGDADLDGDGVGDVLLASQGHGGGAGAVYVFQGPVPGAILPATAADATIMGQAAGEELGKRLQPVGDTNGDGLDDFAVASLSSGAMVFLFAGPVVDGTTSADAIATLASIPGESSAATALGAVGDTNCDGLDDVLVSHQYANLAFLMYGGWTGAVAPEDADGAFHTTVTGNSIYFGQFVAGGDIDGDGHSDVVVNAYGAGSGGEVYIFSGATVGAP